jgi:hypothetical protein
LIQSITFRPEVRYDTSLNGTTPFDGVNVPGGRGFPGFGVGAKGEQFTSAETSSRNSKSSTPGATAPD